MPHQDGRDVVPNQPIPRRAGAPASGRHDQSSSWTVKTSAASGHDGTAIRLVARFIAGRDSWRAQREPFETVALLSASDPVDGRADLLRDQLEDLQHLTERVASEVEHHVGEPERLVRGELVHDGLARVGGQSVPQGYADRQRDGLEWPARGVRRRAQAVEARGELRWGLRRGVPAIAERHDTPKGAWAVPADPDRRMRLLDRLGGEADVVESIELTCEAWVVGRPQLLEDAEDLVGLPPASVERRVEDRELLLPPSDAHTADEPPVGQRVDRRQHLRHHDRVAVAEDEDRRADACPRGRDRSGRKDCDRLEVGRVGREGKASAGVPAGGRSREDHVVAHPERSDLAVLRLSAEGEQRLARRDGALRRQMATDVHSGLGVPATRVASVHGDEDTVARLAVERLGTMPLPPRVLDEDHLAGADPSRLAVARGDLHARVEIDDVLPPRGGMPIQVVLGLDFAEDDPGSWKARGQPPRAARFREGDLHVLEVRLTVRVDVEPVDLHGAPSHSGIGLKSLASPPINNAARRSVQAVFAGVSPGVRSGISPESTALAPTARPDFSVHGVRDSPYFRKNPSGLSCALMERVLTVSILGARARRHWWASHARPPWTEMWRRGP